MPFVSRTRAILRSAEFGFFGVMVATRVQTPRRWGAATGFLLPWADLRPGVATFFLGRLRPLRTSWLMLGMRRRMLAAALALARGRGPAAERAFDPPIGGRNARFTLDSPGEALRGRGHLGAQRAQPVEEDLRER